jgi:2-haloacid dehalogenase
MGDFSEIRALTFDVFGTVVDWRGSVLRECQAIGRQFDIETDWDTFVDSWRYDGYIGGMAKVIRGELPFQTTDALHHRHLLLLLEERGIDLPGDAIESLNRAWHRLEAWPDSPAGLRRLHSRYVVSTLSNGNTSLLVAMARHADLVWDCVLSAETTGSFKPDPDCYRRAVELLGCEPAQVMMAACHQNDLLAAQSVGLRAAFIQRPDEAGPHHPVNLTPDPGFDIVARDIEDLADQLGC